MSSRQHQFDAMTAAVADDLFRYAVWLCRDRDLAQDLVQETLLRAWRFMDKLRDSGAVKAWLLTTLRREHARLYERKRLDRVDMDMSFIEDESGRDPFADAERRELQQRIAALPEDYREPLAMQVILGCKVAEIAEAMALSESAVMTRLFRARKQLTDGTDRAVESVQ
ncbi:MAG: sigma-70 family RNA polymerase sigma factor [Salinisphaeraceae bacterium]